MLVIDETKLMMVLLEKSTECQKEIQERIANNETIDTALKTIKEMTNGLPEEKQKIVFYEIEKFSKELMRVCSRVVSEYLGDSITEAVKG